MKIHENLTEARQAVKEYLETILELQERLGISEECEDSSCSIGLSVKYKDENGNVKEYYG